MAGVLVVDRMLQPIAWVAVHDVVQTEVEHAVQMMVEHVLLVVLPLAQPDLGELVPSWQSVQHC